MSIITITGDLASGKSLVAKKMAAELGAEYFSTGSMQREIAEKYGMTTLELNRYSESHPEIDQEIDDRVRRLRDSGRELVVDSRMAWYFLPDSFKVYLSTHIVRAAERVIADTERSNEPRYKDRNDAMLKLMERKRSENKRYLQLYNADCSKLTNFDFVVDTTYSIPDDAIRTIIAGLKDWQRKLSIRRYWYSPRSILPLRPPAGLDAEPGQTVQVLIYKGDLYIYRGHGAVFEALSSRKPYLPVDVLAEDAQSIPEDGCSAAQYVERAYDPEVLPQWEQRFGFQYLALSGPFNERSR